MASKLNLLYNSSLEVISTFGWSYFLRIASYEIRKQGLDLFRHPTLDYYSVLESEIESQEELYTRYIQNFNLQLSKDILENKKDTLKIKPKFTIVIIIEQKNFEYIKNTIASIKEQIYNNYEILLLSSSTLDDSYFKNNEENFQDILCITKISDIQKNSNGDLICFLQSGDKISKNTLFKITYFINNNPDSDLIYTDHDFFDGNNLRINPFFKPDWSPILFQSVDYLSTFFIVKKDIFNQMSFDVDSSNMSYSICKEITEKSRNTRQII